METGEGAGWNRGRSCLPPQTPAAPACRGLSVHDSCLSPAIRVREWRFLIQASRGGTFRLFELADSRDRLELRDVSSGNLLRAFDGAHPPPPGPLRLRTAALLLTFRSDARGHAQGFALTYRGEPGASPSDAAHTTALLATSPHTSLRRAAGYSGGQSISRGFN